MKKVMMMLMLAVGWSAVMAEKVPVEVQQAIADFISGHGHYSWEFDNSAGFLESDAGAKLSDMRAGEPFHVYEMLGDSLRDIDPKAPVMTYAKPIDEWDIPLRLHEKNAVLLMVDRQREDRKWLYAGYGGRNEAIQWEKVCKTWLKSLGFNPILIRGPFGRVYFHIPEKGDSNLTLLILNPKERPLSARNDTMYKTLTSSSEIIKGLQSGIRRFKRRGGQWGGGGGGSK